MGRIITLHSYRGGTGKSNVTSNLAYLTAKKGYKVATLDTDIQSPGVHLIFGISPDRITSTLSDFVLGKCEIEETVYDVSNDIGLKEGEGKLMLLPSSMSVEDISRVIAEGYNANKLNSEFKKLMEELNLDYLFVDTHPGLNKETLLTTAISDCLNLLIRPDKQDYYGTALLVEIANRLKVPQVNMLVNKVLASMDKEAIQKKIEEAYHFPVIGMLPLHEDVMSLGSRKLFTQEYPTHTWTAELSRVCEQLLENFAHKGSG